MTTTTLIPVPRTVAGKLTLRGFHHIIGAMVPDDIISAIIKLLYLTILDESMCLFDDLVVYSLVAHPLNHPIGYIISIDKYMCPVI